MSDLRGDARRLDDQRMDDRRLRVPHIDEQRRDERPTADRATADRGTADRGTADRGTAERGPADRGTADRGADERHLDERRLAELRDAFDRAFAEAPPPPAPPLETFLDITAGSTRYALRTAEITGLLADVPITPLPTPLPELLGLCVVRGAVLPVYDLRALLGHRTETTPRWIVTTASPPLALAFDTLEGQARVARDSIAPGVAPGGTPGAAPVISIASIVEAVTRRVRGQGFAKE